jgi:hypothetical protein
MKNFEFIAGIEKVKFKVPEGRHEVSYDKWMNAYPYIKLAEEAQQALDLGDNLTATQKSIESMTHVICELSEGIRYDQLIKIKMDKINNLFLTAFNWLGNERPKKEFNINGKKFIIPEFINASAGDFMDCTALIQVLNENVAEEEKGLIIGAVYMRDGQYIQDLQSINERKEFLKKYAKMDFFFSCSFFLLNSLQVLGIHSSLHLTHREELQKLISSLNEWATILYLQASQKQVY